MLRFASLLSELGLENLKLSRASLRPGKATALYVDAKSIERLRFIGCWRALETFEHYIQEAVALSVLMRLPPSAARFRPVLARCRPVPMSPSAVLEHSKSCLF